MQEDIIGFVGLGQMGAAIARRLLAAGHKLMVYDLNPLATHSLEQAGAQVSPELGAQSTDASARKHLPIH